MHAHIPKHTTLKTVIFSIHIVGSQIAAHTLMETGNGPNEPNTINL